MLARLQPLQPILHMLNLTPLVKKVNEALYKLKKQEVQIIQVQANSILRNLLGSNKWVTSTFGNYLGLCPFKLLNKCSVYVNVENVAEKVTEKRYQISHISISYYGEIAVYENTINRLDTYFNGLNYSALRYIPEEKVVQIQHDVLRAEEEDSIFDFSHISKISFI